MAGASLLSLLDDITSVLDDVALMTKVAAHKTTGVLGDDLALNAEQVSGVRAERELPVVWAVLKGSLRNKAILVPAALLISAFIPWLIMPLLMLGGLFLCFEGVEKLFAKWLPHSPEVHDDQTLSTDIDVEQYEKEKVAGAIRTDFILSSEIIMIALGTVQHHPFLTQLLVVSIIAVIMTFGVYGLVGVIVKLDDAGLYLVEHNQKQGILRSLGLGLVNAAPYLMKALTIIGTIAMFLVGGGIIVHNIPLLHEWINTLVNHLSMIPFSTHWLPLVLHGVLGIIAGLIVLCTVMGINRIKSH